MSAILEIHAYNCCTDYADLRKLWAILPKLDVNPLLTPIFNDFELKTHDDATWSLSVAAINNFELIKLEYPANPDDNDFVNGVVNSIKSGFPNSTLMVLTEDKDWYTV